MKKLTPKNLMSLEEYHNCRNNFRREVLEHKKNRKVSIGVDATLYFEDNLTIKYQVQEVLRIEKVFELDAIEEELSAYNPLIPDGTNLKATFMIEIPDVDERRKKLSQFIGIEDRVYALIEDEKIFAIPDEDLERSDEEKTSAVHFLRFEFDKNTLSLIKNGAAIAFGIDHPNYEFQNKTIPLSVHESLTQDLD
ncbi:MAG: hypothetical protein CBC38_04715 [Gammaproteobacteria bacterium TMED78]|nr:MAG: hypothetical protein CBC38_04715 [Gammaproteobacteria bacterium TMED78]